MSSYGGMKLDHYQEIVDYIRMKKFPNYVGLDKETVKNRKRALKRTCADFHLDGTTLMYLQRNKRKLRSTNVCRVDGSGDAQTGTTDGSAIEVESRKKSVAPRRVVLEGYVEDEIALIHDEVGHSIRGTYQAVNSRLYWNSVQRDCKIFCKTCQKCQKQTSDFTALELGL